MIYVSPNKRHERPHFLEDQWGLETRVSSEHGITDLMVALPKSYVEHGITDLMVAVPESYEANSTYRNISLLRFLATIGHPSAELFGNAVEKHARLSGFWANDPRILCGS